MDQTPGAQSDAADPRDPFIPIRKADLIEALIGRDTPGRHPDPNRFREFCRRLGAVYHFQYFEQRERLRNDYYYFQPELDGGPGHPGALDAAAADRIYRDLIDTLMRVLHEANFTEVPRADIEAAHRQHSVASVRIKTPVGQYREVRFFRRGHHRETVEISRWFGWRKRMVEHEVHDDVVLLVALKPAPSEPGRRRGHGRKPRVRPGAVLLKHFRDIAGADLDTLYPDVRVVMGWRDQLVLGVPAVVGGIPILLKLASTLTVLLIVAGYYLGFANTVRDDEMAGALAAVSGLVALGGFIATQWVRFQRQSLLHQKTLSENVYYRNVNNNAGIFDTIIGEAEEQECKETFTAYAFLLASPGATADALDRDIAIWLRQAFGTAIDFDSSDALGKLSRLGLLDRDGDRLSVPPLEAALARLGQAWDGIFPTNADLDHPN